MAVASKLSERRLVTIAGAGGFGKTRFAEAAASSLGDTFAHGVWWVELASITDDGLVPTAVARALGLSPPAIGDSLQSIVARSGTGRCSS